MSIGTISSPSSWALGTVAAPTWFQNVQDNINNWIAGTGSTLASLQIDGTGGSASTVAAGCVAYSGRLIAKGSTSPITVAGSAAGTSPTITFPVTSNDTGGQIQIVAGATAGAGTVVTLKLSTGGSRTSKPYMLIIPVNTNAQGLASSAGYSGNDWTIFAGNALVNGQAYIWQYLVIESA